MSAFPNGIDSDADYLERHLDLIFLTEGIATVAKPSCSKPYCSPFLTHSTNSRREALLPSESDLYKARATADTITTSKRPILVKAHQTFDPSPELLLDLTRPNQRTLPMMRDLWWVVVWIFGTANLFHGVSHAFVPPVQRDQWLTTLRLSEEPHVETILFVECGA